MSPIHCSPEDAVRVHEDIQSKRSVGMHWGTVSFLSLLFLLDLGQIQKLITNMSDEQIVGLDGRGHDRASSPPAGCDGETRPQPGRVQHDADWRDDCARCLTAGAEAGQRVPRQSIEIITIIISNYYGSKPTTVAVGCRACLQGYRGIQGTFLKVEFMIWCGAATLLNPPFTGLTRALRCPPP